MVEQANSTIVTKLDRIKQMLEGKREMQMHRTSQTKEERELNAIILNDSIDAQPPATDAL